MPFIGDDDRQADLNDVTYMGLRDRRLVGIIQERLQAADCSEGFILDGFPRTVQQAEALAEMLKCANAPHPRVVLFEVPDSVLHERLENRRGAEARADDAKDVQLERLRVYRDQTAPLISFYEERSLLERVEGVGSVEEVQNRLRGRVNVDPA